MGHTAGELHFPFFRRGYFLACLFLCGRDEIFSPHTGPSYFSDRSRCRRRRGHWEERDCVVMFSFYCFLSPVCRTVILLKRKRSFLIRFTQELHCKVCFLYFLCFIFFVRHPSPSFSPSLRKVIMVRLSSLHLPTTFCSSPHLRSRVCSFSRTLKKNSLFFSPSLPALFFPSRFFCFSPFLAKSFHHLPNSERSSSLSCH